MDRAVSQQLIKNLATLKSRQCTRGEQQRDVIPGAKGTPHNIVFVDPPFRRGLLEETINLLEDNGWLADEALIYVESESRKRVCPLFRQTGHYIGKKWRVRWLIGCINAKHKEKVMLINIGRFVNALCLGIFNPQPGASLPTPAEYFR